MNKKYSLDQILKRTGGWFIIISVAVAQIIALLGMIPGLISIQVNARFNDELIFTFLKIAPFTIISSNLIILGTTWGLTTTARKRLNEWSQGLKIQYPNDEYQAWREITSLTWRFGILATIVNFVLNILPPFFIALSHAQVSTSPFQPNSLGSQAPVYILLGGTVSILGSTILAILMVERFTRPARLVLLPKEFETQLKGRAGALLIGKFQILILALIMIGILLIAPIGYEQTVRVLYTEVSSFEVFRDLRIQSFLFSGLALIIGAILSYFVFRAVSDPIRDLIDTFNKIEQGDLSQRAPVNATDELGIVTVQFNRMVSRLEELQNTLETQVAERTKQLTATNDVGRVASSSLDPDELLARVINLFTNQFGYYYAAIYLLDSSGKWAELKEATSEAGKVLKQNHHRLEVTGRSMVGTSIRERSARIAQIASEEIQRIENPLLPYTRSEVALPLMVGDRVLGALNVQSTKESDFGPEIIETMQNMARQVAIALDNARLFQEAQQSINEMRSTQRRYLLEAWNEFNDQAGDLEYGVGDLTNGKSKKIEVPIILRDQQLGQIILERNEEWTPEQESLIDAIATQAAIALENARLVNESRQIATRERMLTEINSKIWASPTIEGVLQTAVKELGRRLDASRATIELNVEDGP